jgi:hypothetical protein
MDRATAKTRKRQGRRHRIATVIFARVSPHGEPHVAVFLTRHTTLLASAQKEETHFRDIEPTDRE